MNQLIYVIKKGVYTYFLTPHFLLMCFMAMVVYYITLEASYFFAVLTYGTILNWFYFRKYATNIFVFNTTLIIQNSLNFKIHLFNTNQIELIEINKKIKERSKYNIVVVTSLENIFYFNKLSKSEVLRMVNKFESIGISVNCNLH